MLTSVSFVVACSTVKKKEKGGVRLRKLSCPCLSELNFAARLASDQHHQHGPANAPRR
jgi:hypothetical protein